MRSVTRADVSKTCHPREVSTCRALTRYPVGVSISLYFEPVGTLPTPSIRLKTCALPSSVEELHPKWIRIIYRCWKGGQPNDEEVYLRPCADVALCLRGPRPTSHWRCVETVAGFEKIVSRITLDRLALAQKTLGHSGDSRRVAQAGH